MEKGLFGLYSWNGNKPNKRTKNKSYLPDNPRYVKKEFNYITELKDEIKNVILDHLKKFNINRKLYDGIKSFEFQNCKNNCNQNDNIAVQEIINKTYFADENIDGTVDWLKLNILRRMKKRGYNEEVSRQYVDKYSKKSKEILEKITIIDDTLFNEEQKKKLENRKKELIKQSQRKCDTFHNIQPYTQDDYPEDEIDSHNKKILLEKLLIPDGERQMILSSNKVTSNYELNPKAIINPWVSRYNMGYISWNMIINKATISCLLNPEHESSKWLFPARIILEKNPNDLFFQNCFKELNDEKKTKYLGFFLIRYNLPEDEIIPPNTDEECKHLYSFSGSKPHKSKEQYYVMFVFKKLQADYKPHEYFIVNFRCNKIPWGDTGELTKILSSEIRQINCMYVNDKVKLYLLVKKKTRAGDALASSSGLNYANSSNIIARMTNEKEIKSIKEICKSQKEEEEEKDIQQTQGKKSYLDCNEAWLHKETFDLLINNNILPYTEPDTKDEKSNIHVLCTNKTINEIAYYHGLGEIKSFENTNGHKIYYIELNDEDNNDKYILTECHFKWDNDNDDAIKSIEMYNNHMESYYDHIRSYDINSTDSQKLDFKSKKHFLEDKADNLYNQAENLYNLGDNQRFLIKHGPLDLDIQKEYKKNFCIKSNCLKTLDTVRFNKLQTLYNVDNIGDREIYSPDFVLNTTFANMEESFQTNAAEQTGGNDNLSKLKFNKYVKKYYELVDVYDKDYKNNKNNNLPFHNNNFTNLPFYNNLIDNNFNNSKLFYNKDNIIKNGENILQNTNFITTIGVGAMFYLGHIKLNNILIITHNIVYADKILHVFKNIKITLLVINNYEIGSFLTLKEKYNFVDIYFLGYYFNCLEPIKEICKNNIYDTIIIDPGGEYIISQIISIALGILLCKDYLHKDGTYMQYCLLPDNINYPANYIYIHNLLYKCFNYHVNNDFNFYFIMKQKYPTLLVYNNFIYNINKEEEEILLDILYNNYTNYTNYDISSEFDLFLTLKWKSILFRSKEYLKTIEKEDKNLKGGYHRIAIKQMKIKIPQTIDDLLNKSKFNGDVKDMAPSCHWGQKKLLLSEIQFLTNVCKKLNTKSLKDYAVVYVGAADGFHFPILYNLFPELIWILYDPGKFSKESYMHPQKQKVKIFNQFFTDETIKHAQQNAENRKILFISDIRVTPKDEQVYVDMINQARWGTSIGADFMLLKFRLPYNEPDTFKPINIVDLKLNKKIINNHDLIAKDTIYLKGDVFLQLYHPQYSTELRLFVEKNTNNKYDLQNYDYIEIENKIFNYNTEIRLIADIEGYEFLNLIPGYNKSIENIMEYEIIKQYYEYFHNIKDKNIIIQKLFDLNIFLEKLTHKLFITCSLNTIIKSINNKKNYIIKKDRLLKLKIWKEIIQLNISISAKYQKDYITKHGLKIIGEERLKKSLKFIEKFITKQIYYELII